MSLVLEIERKCSRDSHTHKKSLRKAFSIFPILPILPPNTPSLSVSLPLPHCSSVSHTHTGICTCTHAHVHAPRCLCKQKHVWKTVCLPFQVFILYCVLCVRVWLFIVTMIILLLLLKSHCLFPVLLLMTILNSFSIADLSPGLPSVSWSYRRLQVRENRFLLCCHCYSKCSVFLITKSDA